MYHIHRNSNTINNVHTQYNGSYIMFFKLIPDLFSSENKQVFSLLPFFGKFTCVGSLTLQFLFKPLLWIFHTVTTYKGTYTHENDVLVQNDVKKTKIFYLFRFIPFFGFKTSKLSNKDWDYLLK